MKTLLLFLSLTIGHFAIAQDDDGPRFPNMRSWGLYGNDTSERYIYADTALVRASPDTKQPPIDTLLAGDNISVTGITTNSLTLRRLKGPWLKITYSKNGEQKNGYIWQGLISCMLLRRGDVKFVVGIERRIDSIRGSGKNKDTSHHFMVRVKTVQNRTIINKQELIVPDDESANSCFGRIMSGMGLTNVQNIVVVIFSGEACGIPEYSHYFAFTKTNQLVRLPGKENISDAGVFYHGETFIFPNEKGGKPDTILWKMTDEEATEKVDKNGNEIMKLTGKKMTAYTWDGVKEQVSGPVTL